MVDLATVTRCPAVVADEPCGSAVFYDWGIELFHSSPVGDVRGGNMERFNDWTQGSNVKICVRCTTPYIVQAGELIDISAELSAEDVKAILTRGQALNPHPKIKDP